MNNDVITWTDGYGRWHAIVPNTILGLSRAARSIALELFERAPHGTTFIGMREYVDENIVSIPCGIPGSIHFAEYEIN